MKFLKMTLKFCIIELSPLLSQVLVSQQRFTGISYVLGPVSHEHQGVYTCDDDGSLPDVCVRDWQDIIWVAG